MGDQENKLYVGNLSYGTDEQALNDLCESNGISVQTVTIIKDKYSNRSKGFGFVEVASAEDVAKAIEALNGKEVDGRTLTVNQARPREDRGRGGGFHGGGGRRDRF